MYNVVKLVTQKSLGAQTFARIFHNTVLSLLLLASVPLFPRPSV